MEFTQSDRDNIIKHDVKLTEMCKTLEKLDNKMDKLGEKIDENVRTYVTKRMFLSINSIIIFLVISLFVYVSTVNEQVIENTVCIENFMDK